MTEDQIERRVERMMDHADREFMLGRLTGEAYLLRLKEISDWAERKAKEERK